MFLRFLHQSSSHGCVGHGFGGGGHGPQCRGGGVVVTIGNGGGEAPGTGDGRDGYVYGGGH